MQRKATDCEWFLLNITVESNHDRCNAMVANDLSNASLPLRALFRLPRTTAEWAPYRLSDEQVAFYHENGYLKGIRILDDRQIEILREELSGLLDPKHPGHELFYEFHSNESIDPSKVLFHALGAWRITPGFHDVLWAPGFTMAASQLLGGAVRFWHDQLFCKPPNHGGLVAWHQDYSYWTRTQPMAHLTCWVGLDESTRDNGCVHYVPGSHRWPLLPITGLAGDMEAIRAVLDDEQWRQFQNPVAIELKAGECSFHHPLMVHGSHENRTDRPRRAFVINCVRDGVKSASDEPLLAGVPAVPAGQPLGGQFFPLLFDPATIPLG
ncbi:MAG TPA: phytanoyl-CoA dioxygenase family protein [Pirellulales bacterium]|nr:phytanoyl-CoA dioxygenase family protein [Pirellulales bacterium]